jgi:hypothetical protein
MAEGFTTNLGLSQVPEIDQKKDPQLWNELYLMRAALKKLQAAVDSYTGVVGEEEIYWDQTIPSQFLTARRLARIYLQATEAINAGQLITITNSGGTPQAALTDGTVAKQCRAFAPAAVANGDWGEFFLFGANLNVVGLTPGATYYMSQTTNGGFTSVKPATNPQPIGFAVSPTCIWFNPTPL